MKRIIYIVLGCLGVALGAIGAVVPLLPTFPFLMLAAFCFARSSQKLSNWFVNTRLYKSNLESFVRGQGMTWAAKIRIMLLVTILMVVGIVMMRKTLVGQIILAVIWGLHIIMFIFGIKTKKVIREDSDINVDGDSNAIVGSHDIDNMNGHDNNGTNSQDDNITRQDNIDDQNIGTNEDVHKDTCDTKNDDYASKECSNIGTNEDVDKDTCDTKNSDNASKECSNIGTNDKIQQKNISNASHTTSDTDSQNNLDV